jgi:hypothetical protein
MLVEEASAGTPSWWNKDWSFKQEIHIPIDTSQENAKFQPIDIRVKFDNPCWAKNEKEHSVRVCCFHNNKWYELESQIYDLNFSDDSHILSCSLVFLIPEYADGKEHYYFYYDDEEKQAPNYPDHVKVEEAYYYFAPIPIYPFESRYYKIVEDGSIVYGVALEGKFLGSGTSQQITKFKTNTKEVSSPTDAESWASFDYFYYYGKGTQDFSSTIQNLISSRILVDGNLMIKFVIVSGSSRKDLRTTAVYKYYYCPNSNKRICVHVKHEALKECKVIANSPNTDSCGNIAGLQVVKFSSPSIRELNFGKMLPFMHVYTEDGIIQEYNLDMDPRHTPNNIKVLGTEHDIDLGEKAWASFDEGKKGEAHAIIFHSNNILVSGTNERDGMQIKAFEGALPSVLGLEIKGESFYLTRNSYEKGLENDLDIPADYVVEYDAEFFSTERGGYEAVDNEANIFQSLTRMRPKHTATISSEKEKERTYSLTTYIHLAPSIPMGSMLSLLTGKNISYITAELYHEDKLISTGTCERLPFHQSISFDNTTFLEKIRLAFSILDLKNATLFKKIKFHNLEPGIYLIKIYRENPIFGKDRKYIGYKIVEIKEDKKIHIFCRPQATIKVNVVDQNGRAVRGVTLSIIDENISIYKATTSEDGTAIVKAPCSLKKNYILRLTYKGFIVSEESIKLRSIISSKRTIEIKRYDFKLNIKDTWGFVINYQLNPILKSEEMIEPIPISAKSTSNGSYIFKDLCPAEYQLELQYKAFSLKENIEIPKLKEKTIVFPVEFDIKINTLNNRGMELKDTKIIILRGYKKVEKLHDKYGYSEFSLPPGKYNIEIYLENKLIGKRKLNVVGEQTIDFVTNESPIFPSIIICISIIFSLFGISIAFKKKNTGYFLKTLAITLILISIVSQWWALEGLSSNNEIQTSTTVFLIPVELINNVIAPTVISGETVSGYLPDLFIFSMKSICMIIIMGAILTFLNMILERFNKNKLSKFSLLLAILSLTGSILIFYYAISTLAKAGIGSFFGKGYMNITIPGEETSAALYCNWGPSFGFYLLLVAIILLIASLVIKNSLEYRVK